MTRSRRRPTPPSAPTPPGRRFRPADQVVVVAVLILASVLAVAGVPTATVLQLLAGAGGIAMGLMQRQPALPRAVRRKRP
ncbi:hypothetical protein [Streptomyces sp. CB03911]|uniref:hypothetical protein n=1 Tax=Streptomycetaceae TaxID=2062 RepID=UPI0018FEA9AE|nr:hypothetical protein [Streptomyces sp. CB03911]